MDSQVGVCDFKVDFASFWTEQRNDCFGHWTEYAVGLLVALCFPIVRFILDRTVFTLALGLFMPHGHKATPDQNLTFVKAKESAWKTLVYVSFVSLALWATVSEKWFTNTAHYWTGCFRLPCHLPTTMRVKLLYCLEMGYYLEEIPMLFLWSIKRKDFGQLVAHHFVTLFLIGYSLELGITRTGAIIYLLHDINDPFMEAAKIARYANRHALSTFFFLLFVASWFVSRIYLFPKEVIRSTMFESKAVADRLQVNIEPHYSILNSLLIFLFILHLYWSYLIVRIIIRQLTEGELDDVREKDD